MSSSPSAATAVAPPQDAIAADGVDVEVKPHKKATESSKRKTICGGYTAKDLVLLPLALILVYTLTGVLFALCTRAVLQTDDTSTALWLFFGIYVAFVVMLGIVLAVTAFEKSQKKKFEDDATESA